MSAQIIDFPTPAALPVVVASTRRTGGRRTYGLAEMVRLLGLVNVTTRTAIEMIRDLSQDRQLPAPVTRRRYGGRVLDGIEAIGQRALWDAAAVDCWLDPRRPTPAAANAIGAPASYITPASLHQTMRLRASEMVRSNGGAA